MNYLSDTLYQTQEEVFTNLYNDIRIEQLEQQLASITEWKRQAMVQLEYFRAACRLYNFCDVHDVNQLLND